MMIYCKSKYMRVEIPIFFNHLWKNKIVSIIRRFEKLGVKLLSLCLNSEGKSGVVAILSLKKLRVRQISILLYSNEGILHFSYQLFLAPLQVACILPQNTINTIFSNVEAIQAVNRELLSHMETKGLGDAFLALAPFIKLYSTYANNFAKAQSELQVSNHRIKLLCSIDINKSSKKLEFEQLSHFSCLGPLLARLSYDFVRR